MSEEKRSTKIRSGSMNVIDLMIILQMSIPKLSSNSYFIWNGDVTCDKKEYIFKLDNSMKPTSWSLTEVLKFFIESRSNEIIIRESKVSIDIIIVI